MPTIVHLEIADFAAHPLLADYANLTDATLRAGEFRAQNLHFIAEGEGVVRQLLSSRFPTRSLLVTPHHFEDKMHDVLANLPSDIPIFLAPAVVMERITGFAFHRGVLASGLVGAPLDAHQIARDSKLLVVCENLSNIENIGAIFRNVACLCGSHAAVILSPTCCNPLYRKSLRVSMGHALRVPFAKANQWPGFLSDLHDIGYVTIALTPADGAQDIRPLAQQLRTTAPRLALLVGAEGLGLSSDTIAQATHAAKIPMQTGADSLNVATALAVALYELMLC